MHTEHSSLTELINALIMTGLTPEQADILTDGLKQCLGRDEKLTAVKVADKIIKR